MKRLIGIAMSLGMAVGIAACSKSEETKTTGSTTTTTKTETKTEAKATDKGPAPAASGESIGVPECDTYIDKYTKCLGKMGPEASAPMKKAMDDTRKAWKDAAATPEGKTALANACKQAMDAAKSATQAMGCEW